MIKNNKSIYKVIHYRPRNTCRKSKLLYLTFKVVGDTAIYYQSLDEVAKMREEYYKIHSGSDLYDHALSTEFNYHIDTYEVLSLVCDELDHAPQFQFLSQQEKFQLERRKHY